MKHRRTIAAVLILVASLITVGTMLFTTHDFAAASALPLASSGKANQIVVSLTPAQAANFEDALKALAAQGRVGFVAEGVPLKPKLTGEASPTVNDLPLDEAVQKVAEAYDYVVISDANSRLRRQSNLYIFQKRYTDPADLPGVTLEEYAAAAEDILRLLSAHGPQPPYKGNREFVREFAPTITDHQRQAMQQNGPLLVSSLSPAQQAQMWRLALHSYVGLPLEDVEQSLLFFRQASKIVLRQGKVFGNTHFGFDFVDVFGRTVFRPVNGEVNAAVWASFKDNGPLPGSNEPQIDWKAGEWAGKQTLSSVVTSLNGRGESGGSSFVVDAALAAKPVTVIGAEVASPTRVFAALAEVYGLRVVPQKEGDGTERLRLTRPARRAAASVLELPERVRHSFPEPLLRALHLQDAENLRREVQHLRQTNINTLPFEQQENRRKREDYLRAEEHRFFNMHSTLVRKAATRLQTIIEPQLTKGGKETGVTVSQLGAEERSAFGLTLFEGVLRSVGSNFAKEPPPHLVYWDQVRFRCGPYQQSGQQFFQIDLTFTVRNPDGSEDTNAMGMTGVPYSSQ